MNAEQTMSDPLYKELIFLPDEFQSTDVVSRGGGKKNILFITVGEGVPSFNSPTEEMLGRMLTNLAATEDDIVLLDLEMNSGISFSDLKKFFNPAAIIFFGGKFSQINLQVELHLNQLVMLNNISLIESWSFSVIEQNKRKERNDIFPLLKKIFSI